MILDRIRQHEVVLPINLNYNRILQSEKDKKQY